LRHGGTGKKIPRNLSIGAGFSYLEITSTN
jgi:hypothetical protein